MTDYDSNRLMQALLAEFSVTLEKGLLSLEELKSKQRASTQFNPAYPPSAGKVFSMANVLCKEHFPQSQFLQVYRTEMGGTMVGLAEKWDEDFGYKFHVGLRKGCDSPMSSLWWNLLNNMQGPFFGYLMDRMQQAARQYFYVTNAEPRGRWRAFGDLRELTRDTLEATFERMHTRVQFELQGRSQRILEIEDNEKALIHYIDEKASSAELRLLAQQCMTGWCSAKSLSAADIEGIWYYHLCEVIDDPKAYRPLPDFEPVHIERNAQGDFQMTQTILRAAASAAATYLHVDIVRKGELLQCKNASGEFEPWNPVTYPHQIVSLAQDIAQRDPGLQSVAETLKRWEQSTEQSGDPYLTTRKELVAYLAEGRLPKRCATPC